LEVDENFKIVDFQEKPDKPKEISGMPGVCFVSMGNYLVEVLISKDFLIEDSLNLNLSHAFGKDAISLMLKNNVDIYAYNFFENDIQGQEYNYWRDVGTVKVYWKANMNICSLKLEINLYNDK
jgi:glucose-1-phosphate adenylyltransferase